MERTEGNLRQVHDNPGKAFPAWSWAKQCWKSQNQDRQQISKKDRTKKRLGTRRLAGIASHISLFMNTWFMALTRALLSGTSQRKARPKAHARQAALTSLLLWISPVSATSTDSSSHSTCSSLLSALHLSLTNHLTVSHSLHPFPHSLH